MGEEKLNSKQLLNKLMDEHYQNALDAKKEGKLVCWATSICPQELLETMDIDVVYPENHCLLYTSTINRNM